MSFYAVRMQVCVIDPDRQVRLFGTVLFERDEFGRVEIDSIPDFRLESMQIGMPANPAAAGVAGAMCWCAVPDASRMVDSRAVARKYATEITEAVYAACEPSRDSYLEIAAV